MKDTRQVVLTQEIACAEEKSPPCGLVVFGASGDLVHRKLLPSVFELFRRQLLNENFYFIGCGRTKLSDENYRADVETVIRQSSPDVPEDMLSRFLGSLYFVTGDYNDPSFYKALSNRLPTSRQNTKSVTIVSFILRCRLRCMA